MPFNIGSLYHTPGITPLLVEHRSEVVTALKRHMSEDWGEVCEEDWAANNAALSNGERLFSVYTVGGVKVWIITEADRSATTVLLPDEY